MSKPLVNALALHLMRELETPLGLALDVATAFVDENAELLVGNALAANPGPATAQTQRLEALATNEAGQPAATDPKVFETEDAIRVRSKPRQPGELMPQQQQALQRGVGLCPNCQQPNDNHLPGCARQGYAGDPQAAKIVTREPLPPAER